MNKTYVIAGGASLVSLAAGAAGGYFYAKSDLGKKFDKRLELEMAASKYNYEQRLKEVRELKAELEDLMKTLPEEVDEEEFNEEDDEPTEEQILEAERVQKVTENGKAALTNYQGFAKPDLSEVVSNNIFDSASKAKKKMPPRDDSGKFIPKKTESQDSDEPYLITQEEFLLNEPEHDQESLRYFIENDTLLDYGNEVIDNEIVGQANLTLFDPDIPDGETNMICVRNNGLRVDYDIRLTREDITEYLGLGTEG